MTTLKRPIWFLFHEQLLSNTNTKARLRQIDKPPLTSNWQRPILLKRQPFCNTDVFPVKYNTSTNTNVLTAKTVVISILWPRLKYKKRSFKTVFVNDIDDINDINDVNHFVIWNTIKDTLLDPDINDINDKNDVNHFVPSDKIVKFKSLTGEINKLDCRGEIGHSSEIVENNTMKLIWGYLTATMNIGRSGEIVFDEIVVKFKFNAIGGGGAP